MIVVVIQPQGKDEMQQNGDRSMNGNSLKKVERDIERGVVLLIKTEAETRDGQRASRWCLSCWFNFCSAHSILAPFLYFWG